MIRAIKEHLEHSVSGGLNKHVCMLMAPTGVAAFNIGGLIIHYTLQCRWSTAGLPSDFTGCTSLARFERFVERYSHYHH